MAVVAAAVVFTVVYGLVSFLSGGFSAAWVLSGALFTAILVLSLWLLTKALERRRQSRLGISAGIAPTTDNETICVAEDCTVAMPVDVATTAVENQITALGRSPQRDVGSDGDVCISASFGSRTALRMFGTNTLRGRRSLPMTVEVNFRADGDDATVAEIRACSDAGWYAVRFPSFDIEYRRTLVALLAQLRGTLAGCSPSSSD